MDEPRKRVSAVIIKDDKILLIRRTKPNEEYFVFPGGGVEEGEDFDTALAREIKEELDIEIREHEEFFSLGDNYFFRIKTYNGVPQIGLHGPEKERMNQENQYHLEWLLMSNLKEMKNVFPQEAVFKVVEMGLW